MDYIGNKCPVCDKYFHANDDIVVCPECGTPHHRECYNNLGHCVNVDKHVLGYEYLADGTQEIESDDCGLVVCKKCGAKNSQAAFFCTKCGNSLHEIKDNSTQQYARQYQNTNDQQSTQQHNKPNVLLFDPLGGVKPDTDLGDGVSVAQAAKYVKQNTPYFITLFANIKNFSKSRFNFCAALFGGGYLLYRKMYKIGAVITVIEALIFMFNAYLTQYINSSSAFAKLFEAYASKDVEATMELFAKLSTYDTLVMLIYLFLGFASLALTIVIGACANRMYFKHCKKKIIQIKNETENSADVDSVLTKKGGVNTALAVSLWASYIILSSLANFYY